MCNSRCNSSCGRPSACARNGEKIIVNQSSRGHMNRKHSCCVNTYRPGYGCANQSCCCDHHESCDSSNCECNHPRPCPPKPHPCPPRPRPCCEERCRAQYRQCMRNCRLREDNHEHFTYQDEKDGYDTRQPYEEDDFDYQRDFDD